MTSGAGQDPRGSDLRDEDLRLVHRLVDGELGADEARGLEQRAEHEPTLARAIEELREQRSLFTSGPIAVPGPRFRGRVLDAVAEAGRRQLSQTAPEVDVLHRWAPRVVWAAALVLAFCGAFASGLFDRAESGDLSASPDALRQRMERLDERIEAEGIEDPFALDPTSAEAESENESDEQRAGAAGTPAAGRDPGGTRGR